MEKGQHINVFDFDETLCRVPNYTSKEARGLEPYEWYDSAESLSPEFGIRGIANVIERTSEPGLNYLVTHRVKQCQDRVLEILSDLGVRFTKTYFLGRGSEKVETLLELIREAEADRKSTRLNSSHT